MIADQTERDRALEVTRSFVVQAPAGSGKTDLLIRRYLRLLEVVEQPEEVVAITFTRKAAGEMRERVLKALPSAAEVGHRLRIQTVDSLCAALTRQMPLLSRFGAPPEPVEDARELRLAAARATFARVDEDDAVAQAAARLREWLLSLPVTGRVPVALADARWLQANPARDPVIAASDADVMVAVDGLKSLSLLFEGSSSRVLKFEHNLLRVFNVQPAAAALLAVLMLRGPQTAAELRANCERLHHFADISAVEGFLDELQAKTPPYVRKLPRATGAREARWVHLLCGEAALVASVAPVEVPLRDDLQVAAAELAAIRAEQVRLMTQMEELRATVARLNEALGQRKEG